MATLVLGAAGAAIGGSIGGAILGVSAATIGGFIGSTIGSVVDSWIISSLAPTQRIEGARLDTLRITSATEGAVIPRLYGRMRMGGNIVWATDFREETKTTTQGGGKGGGGGKVKTTEYLYYASFAVALCEGPINGIGRIWADGKPMDLSGVTLRWYPGDEAQGPDPFIAAKMGAASTPAYRGTAYVVFEELALSTFGNRLPQLSFEVFRPLADPDTAEGLTRAVTMIPASGEFTYATQAIRKTDGGATVPENLNALADSTDMVEALDRLQAMAPAVESISLVVAWFADDLRAGSCKVRPGVEVSAKSTTPVSWSVNGVNRASAFLVSRDDEDRPVYGGTPSDFAVVQAIQEMKARGLRVTFYPFILMDVPPANTLPNPYSDNAAEAGQPAFPWRGRITCSPAAGYDGTVDKTATAASQVTALFGAATPASFGTTPAALQNLALLGLGTTADTANPFSAKLNAALWTAKTVAEGGNGDLFYTMNKEAAGDDLGLTLQTGFVTKALVGLFGTDRFRLAVSADGSTFFDGLIVDNTNGIVDQPRLPRFKAWTNYDNYVGVGTWTKIGLNNTDTNDQGAFDAANNLFVAPVDGTYLFGATLLYKINASATARMRGRLVLNGTTEIHGSLGEISATHVSLATAIWLQTMVPLTAGDTVELQGYFRVADGYFAADHTSFWGCKVG